MHPRSHAVAIALTLVTATPLTGVAQQITPDSLVCDGYQLPLDGLSAPPGDAPVARLGQIRRLYGLVKVATQDCLATSGIPACADLAKMVADRGATPAEWVATDDTATTNESRVKTLSHDFDIETAARRAVAFQRCLDNVNKLDARATAQLTGVCGDLLRAENDLQAPGNRIALMGFSFLVPLAFGQGPAPSAASASAPPLQPPPSPPAVPPTLLYEQLAKDLVDKQGSTPR